MASTYDFIVVGCGPAGSAAAAGLANSPKHPKVLLLEAGGNNNDKFLRVDGQRWITLQNKDLNWGYKTTPQAHLNDRQIDYSRGRGLGGSSAINFGVYTVGARDDYDEWARLVNDDAFSWDRMQARFKGLETFHADLPSDVENGAKYASPNPSDHGHSGPLNVGFASEWERDLPPMLDALEQAGFPLNPDHNSGNPMGMAVLVNSSHKGLRVTSKDLVYPSPDNLTILTDSPVQRLVMEGKKVVGVETNGTKYFASNEVVLAAGALDTPRILMHSGIGPKDQLESYKIPVVHPMPAIGQGLRDHFFAPIVYSRAEGSTDRRAFYGDQKAMDEAFEQWKKDGTGPWAKFACEMGIGWAKLDRLTASKEFQELPADEQKYLLAETVPHYELLTHFPVHWFLPNFPSEKLNYSCLLAFLYNSQSRGQVTLQSSDPNEPLLYDPNFLSHPFDRRAAIEILRDTLRIARTDGYAKDNVDALAVPKSESDEDLLEYWKQTTSSSWHMTGTVKMGKPGEAGEYDVDDVAVDSDFRVLGIEGVRVGDMSVVPVLASCHVQAVAYATGATCAEKLVREYYLG